MRINSPTISFSSEGSGESSDGYFSEVFETGTEDVSVTYNMMYWHYVLGVLSFLIDFTVY